MHHSPLPGSPKPARQHPSMSSPRQVASLQSSQPNPFCSPFRFQSSPSQASSFAATRPTFYVSSPAEPLPPPQCASSTPSSRCRAPLPPLRPPSRPRAATATRRAWHCSTRAEGRTRRTWRSCRFAVARLDVAPARSVWPATPQRRPSPPQSLLLRGSRL